MRQEHSVPSLKKLGDLLRARREACGLTQKNMYLTIGMPQQQYQKVEAGNDLRISTLLRVAEGLGLALKLVPIDTQPQQELIAKLDTGTTGRHTDPPFESVAQDYFSGLRDADDE